MVTRWVRELSLLITLAMFLASGGDVQALAQAPQADRNVNMVSGTQWPGGDPFLQRQNEPSIAVSSRNSQHLLAGANDYRTVDLPGVLNSAENGDAWHGIFKSFDGGNTWTSTLLPGYTQDTSREGTLSPLKGFQAGSDPTVRASTNGLFYYSGIAFNRGEGAKSILFLARYIDNNNKEAGDPIQYIDTNLVHKGNKKHFVDKPWLAVDIPRPNSKACSIRVPNGDGTFSVRSFPGGNVYVSYTDADGEDADSTRLMFTRSTNCGVTWEGANPLSHPHTVNQGSVIAIDPNTGTVYVAWRQIFLPGISKSPPHAIMIATSTNGGVSFSKPVMVASIAPFDLGTLPSSGPGSAYRRFRTSTYPTMAIDASPDISRPGRIYVAWSELGRGPGGDARIVASVSLDGASSWSPVQVVDNASGKAGHQIMPSMTFSAGKLMLLFYDFRGDLRPIAAEFVADPVNPSPTVWHTVDVRAAEADPANAPVFVSTQVSRYLYLLGASRKPRQVQASSVNYPIFAQGTVPFMGDYIDIAAPTMIQDSSGRWKFNTETLRAPVFQSVWTDNRDVIPPPKPQNWTKYAPPGALGGTHSKFDPTQTVQACVPGVAGMRNQNIYTARITQGLVVSSPGNAKPLGKIQRAFVVYVENATNISRTYRLTIAEQPPAGKASFLQFEQRTSLDVTIARRSSIARTVYVTSSDSRGSTKVNAVEITSIGGAPVPGGLQSSVVLNPDILNPDILNPDILNPDILNPDILNLEVSAPNIESAVLRPDILNPDILNPDILNPDILNPDILNPDILNPDILNPDILNPDILNPDILNPDILNPDILNTDPDVLNADKSKLQINDIFWTVKNNGNTTSAFSFKLTFPSRPKGFKFQLLIYRVSSTPAVNGCTPVNQQHEQLVANIVNPDILNPDILNPDILNGDVRNASLFTAPGDSAKVQLRVFDLDKFDANKIEIKPRTQSTARSALSNQAFDLDLGLFGDVEIGGQPVTASLVSQAVDTAAAQAGITQPSAATTRLTITTTVLPAGRVNAPFSYQLLASGGTEPLTWSLAAGSTLPSNLTLSPTGLISGTPTTAGTFVFTVQVMDSSNPQQVAMRELTLSIAPPLGTPALIFVAEPAVCSDPLNPSPNCTRQDVPIAPPVSVRALDATGAPVPGVSVSIAIGLNGGGGTLGGITTATTDSSGIAGFGTLTLSQPGAYTLVASAASYAPVTTATFNVIGNVRIATTSLPDGITGAAYNATVLGTGGIPPRTWSITAGALPAGLSLSDTTGVISGLPTTIGLFSFAVQVTDAVVPQQFDTKALSIRVSDPVQILTTSLPDDTASTPYNQTVVFSGGFGPFTFTLNGGTLPAGLTLSPAGVISGTPTLSGTFNFTVKVTDSSNPAQTAQKPLTIVVTGAVGLSGLSAVSGIRGSTINLTLTGSGFVPGGTTVSFSGGGALAFVVSATTSTLVTTAVLSAPPGPHAVTVSTAAGTSNSLTFTITPNPLPGAGLWDVTHLAGSTGGPGFVSGSAAATKFREPVGVWGDSAKIYVTDFLNHKIRELDLATGATRTLAGSALAPGNADGFGDAARFFHPTGLWGDGTNLWVADTDNSLIRKIVLATQAVTTVAGSSTGFADGMGTAAGFAFPHQIWGDGTDLYIADFGNHIIRKMNLATSSVTTLAGTPGSPGSADGIGAEASFNNPGGIWGDGIGNLYVVDSGNHTVRQIVIATGSVTTIAGMAGSIGSANGVGAAARFNLPAELWGDGTNLYVADSGNHLIRSIVIATQTVSTLAGSPGATGDVDGIGSAARFNLPFGVWRDAAGNLYVADGFNHAIRKIVIATAAVSTFSGQPARSGSTDAIGDAARFYGPSDTWGDGTGNLYVIDRFNHLIRKVVIATGQVTTVGGQAGVCGAADGIGTAALFCDPNGIWGDGANLYIAGGASRTIRKIVIATLQVSTIAGSAFASGSTDAVGSAARFGFPNGIWGDGTNLFITDFTNNTIRKVVLNSNAVSTLAGLALSSGSTDGIGPAARFNRPSKLWGNTGSLYVTDSNNHTIRRIVIATAQVTTLAGTAGQCGSVDAAGGAARFCSPIGIWGDGAHLYVTSSDQVRKIEIATAAVSTLAGLFGEIGSDDANGSALIFNSPEGLWGDGTSLYIGDVRNNAVRQLTGTASLTAIPYSTGFESPAYSLGVLAGQDAWSVFRTSAAVNVQSAVVASGSRAVVIDAAVAGGQTGPHHLAVSSPSDTRVMMEADVRLASSSVMTSWQFAGLNSALNLFIGGFNVLPNGRLQILTAGAPLTAPVVVRDVWNHYRVVYDFSSQTFDVYINGVLIAGGNPLWTALTTFGRGIFDTFGAAGGNDKGYIDNFQISAVPD